MNEYEPTPSIKTTKTMVVEYPELIFKLNEIYGVNMGLDVDIELDCLNATFTWVDDDEQGASLRNMIAERDALDDRIESLQKKSK